MIFNSIHYLQKKVHITFDFHRIYLYNYKTIITYGDVKVSTGMDVS